MDINTLEKKLLQNPKFAKEYYNDTDLAFEISEMVIDARIKRVLTQKQLADKVGTKQSSIARLESGSQIPSLSFLEKIAKALNTKLLPPKFALLETNNEKSYSATVNYTVDLKISGLTEPINDTYFEKTKKLQQVTQDSEFAFNL